VDFPIKNGDFPISYVSLPEGKQSHFPHISTGRPSTPHGKTTTPGLQISMRRDEWRRCDPVILGQWHTGYICLAKVYHICHIWYMANGIPNISLMANGIPYVHHLSLVFRIVERKVGGDMSKWCPNIVSDQSLRPWSPQDVYFFTMFLKYQWIGSREHRITGNHRFS
jgi:hypothetical protein